jgi:hypothetical protein
MILLCLLCGRRAAWLCVWAPTPAALRRLGAAGEKLPVVHYNLCNRCRRRSDAIRRAENRIFGDVAARVGVN